MRVTVLLLLLCGTLAAQEGSIAPANRWTDPRGAPAGSFRSAAAPLVGDLEEAFSIALPGRALHAPLHWDGLAYLMCQSGEERTLVAIDLYLGEQVAKKKMNAAARQRPVLWNGVVIVNEVAELAGYRRSKKSFKKVWKSRRGSYTDPVVWGGEIYTVASERLVKLRLGRNLAAWSAGEGLRGLPAVYGEAVYVCGHEDRAGIYLYAFHRRTGQLMASTRVAYYARSPEEMPGWRARFQITVTAKSVYVRPPRGVAGRSGEFSHVSIPRSVEGGRLRFGESGLFNLDLPPSGHTQGVVVSHTEKGEMKWERWSLDRVYPIASSERHPDLLQRRVPAVVLGDIVYFGTWAADIRSGEVAWRLPRIRTNLPAVPAEGLVLIVDPKRGLIGFRKRGSP